MLCGPGGFETDKCGTDDTDLCVLPLTSDLILNPFRVRGFEPETSQLLLHSILALSSQHQVNLGLGQNSEAQEHRSRASELLTLELKNREMANRDNSVLAAILILITLDVRVVWKAPRIPWMTLILVVYDISFRELVGSYRPSRSCFRRTGRGCCAQDSTNPFAG
jgi:hypothetical protein